MHSRADLRAGLCLLLVLAGCSGDPPPPPTDAAATREATAPDRSLTVSPTPSTSATSTEAAIRLPIPGTPWDGEDLIEEMHASRRPDGVPDVFDDPAVADAIADLVWTVDGRMWDTASVGGFCGAATCTLELAGAHLERAGEDLWVLELDQASGEVGVASSSVQSLPVELVEELDSLARRLDGGGSLTSLALATATWLPPPAREGRFALSYRTGGEEGSCSVDLVVDAVAGRLVEKSATGC